jgi:hypothetical protein
VTPPRSKRTIRANLDGLPEGVFVTLGSSGGDAFLILGEHLLGWSPGGYTERRKRPGGIEVGVLTPASTVAAIRAGYRPEVHPSAFRA